MEKVLEEFLFLFNFKAPRWVEDGVETRVAGINRVGGETNHPSKVGEDSKEDGETNHPNKVGDIKGAKEDGELSELEYYDFDYFKT